MASGRERERGKKGERERMRARANWDIPREITERSQDRGVQAGGGLRALYWHLLTEKQTNGFP